MDIKIKDSINLDRHNSKNIPRPYNLICSEWLVSRSHYSVVDPGGGFGGVQTPPSFWQML